ncbi:stage II sporulation protein M [Bacillus pinisoli]|uniref:stage II sporulation protein M n=1 Tax=Bacillus pinisoli TaxID=2901866 RepID=UPI001FF43D14|nr:stage II sporulation protein M [Bacillus pinisoli]
MKNQSWKHTISIHIKEHSSIYLFITILFMMGIVFGAIVVNSLSVTQKTDLYMYLSRFFGQVVQGEFANAHDLFLQSYSHHIKYIGLMWILGISIIGLPIILILLFLKGIVVGFTVGFLVNQLGFKGFLLSFVSVLPQNLIIIPAFIIIGTIAVSFSLRLIGQIISKRGSLPFMQIFTRYTGVAVIICCLVALASAFEAYSSPLLMKQVVNIINK